MKLAHGVLLCALLTSFLSFGQNSVGIGVASPNKNAVLELISPNNNQGLLIPKLTTLQRTSSSFTGALSTKENGLMVFDSDESKFYFWQIDQWKELGMGSTFTSGDGISIVNNVVSTIPQDLEVSGSTLTITNNPTAVPINLSALNIPQDVKITGSTLTVTNNPAAVPINLSDLNIPQDLQLVGSTISITNNPSATGIDLTPFAGTNTDGQTLTYDGATGQLSISQLSGVAQSVTLSTAGVAGGDLTGSYPNPSVANNAITSIKIADGAVASVDVLDNSIASTDILDGAVTSIDILDNAIASADIFDGTVALVDLAAGSVNSSKIVDGSIVNADISATAAINVSKLTAGTSGQVLTTSGSTVGWGSPSGSSLINNVGVNNLFAGASVGGPSGTVSSDNTFFGFSAGSPVSAGQYNVAMGSFAGVQNSVGNLNVLIGWAAGSGVANSFFNGNTFVGAQAGQVAVGGPNTFIGSSAGLTTSTGTQNVFIGNFAGDANTNGGQNTIVGYDADVSAGGWQNSSAIGFQASINANNKIRLGNDNITVIEGKVAFTAASDRRLKTNIKPFENGLDLVMKLKPMSYNMKNSDDIRTNWGFIAQDIEALVGENNAVLTVSNNNDRTLGLRYTDFIAPLVKAVQEQQEQITDLKSKLSESEKKYEMLAAELERIKKAIGLKADIK